MERECDLAALRRNNPHVVCHNRTPSRQSLVSMIGIINRKAQGAAGSIPPSERERYSLSQRVYYGAFSAGEFDRQNVGDMNDAVTSESILTPDSAAVGSHC